MTALDRFEDVVARAREGDVSALDEFFANFYPCRKASEEGSIPKGTPMIFVERVPPGWELMGPDDPWLRRMFG